MPRIVFSINWDRASEEQREAAVRAAVKSASLGLDTVDPWEVLAGHRVISEIRVHFIEYGDFFLLWRCWMRISSWWEGPIEEVRYPPGQVGSDRRWVVAGGKSPQDAAQAALLRALGWRVKGDPER